MKGLIRKCLVGWNKTLFINCVLNKMVISHIYEFHFIFYDFVVFVIS